MNLIRIGEREVGDDRAVLVIAEIGVNHDGREELALKLVDHAKAAGADAVKLQLFRAEKLMHRSSRFAGYQQERVTDADPVAMLKRYELADDACVRIVNRIRERGMIPLATPFSPDDVPTIAALDLPAVKIASPDLVNRVLLRDVVALCRPILVSTGAATLDEIVDASRWLHSQQVQFSLLHCISSYPVNDDSAMLGWIPEIRRVADVPVGYSDHTTSILAGALAVSAGACIVEKHLTYDRRASGPDHSASFDPAEFAEYVCHIRLAEKMRGSGGKRVLSLEEDVRSVSRQSLVLRRAIQPGEVIQRGDLTAMRPAGGISAVEVDAVIGRTTSKSLAAGTMLTWDDLT